MCSEQSDLVRKQFYTYTAWQPHFDEKESFPTTHTLRERAHHGQKAEMGPCAAGSRVPTRTFWLRSINGETVEGERGCNEILRYEGKAGKAPLKCVDPLSGDSGARRSFSDLPCQSKGRS